MAERPWPPLPKHVRGQVRDYIVKRGELQDTDNVAECDHDRAELRIGRDLSLPIAWEFWFHEWVHKLERESGIQTLDDGDTPGDKSIGDVHRLARALLADFRRNGWLLPGQTE